MENNRKGTGKVIAALLLSVILLGSFFAAAPASASYIPQDPKEDIITVEIWDEVVWDDSVYVHDYVTLLHVTYYTKEPSDPEAEVSISLEDDEANSYGTAVHLNNDNVFYHDPPINMEEDRTGETIYLFALASLSGHTDRAPNDGFYEYVLGTGTGEDPVIFDDSGDKAAHDKGKIKDVVIEDEVIGDHTVLHVTFYTKKEIGNDIAGRLEDSEGNTYDATHASDTNEFYVGIHYAGIRTTEDTILLAISTFLSGGEEIDIDRYPNVGYQEHTFSAEPPAIDIEKATNGQDADTGTGPGILVGSTVIWTYVVTNTGNFSLTSVMVTDDQLGEIGTNLSLGAGESVTLTVNGTAEPGQYENMGTATGTPPGGLADVSDTDPSHYLGVDSGIDIEKATNGQDADAEPGPEILAGSPVTWTYVVTNTGNAELTNVVVTDDQLGKIGTIPSLAAGESVTFNASGTAEPGQYENMGTATGTTPSGLADVSDIDPSHYLGTTPPFPLGPTSRVYNAATGDAATGDPVLGATVTLFYSATGDAESFVQVDEDNPPPSIYPTVNPQTTDLDGHYGWMVSEGYYYVHAEKAGFSPKDGPVVSAPPGVTTLNIGLDPLPFIAPKQLKEQALAVIIDYNKVIKHIQKSLDDKYWEDDSHLTKKGKKVFEEEEKAVKELMKIEKKDSSVSPAIGFLVEADRLLAQIAIDDAVAAGGDAKKIAKAEKEIAKAEKEIAIAQKDIDKGKYDKAIDHYRKAWEHAQKVT